MTTVFASGICGSCLFHFVCTLRRRVAYGAITVHTEEVAPLLWANASFHDLSQRALCILRQAGEPIDMETLTNWMRLPDDQVEQAVNELRQRGLIQGNGPTLSSRHGLKPHPARLVDIDHHLVRAFKEHASLGELYFAYGSNLNPARLDDRGIVPRFLSRAGAPGYLTGFPRSSRDGGGVAGLLPAPGETAYGALYLLTDDEWESLDFYEEVPRSYHRAPLNVTVQAGPSQRVLIPRLCVITYMAQPGIPADPRADYVEHILVGAKYWQLPESLIDFLTHVPRQSNTRRVVNLRREPGWQRLLRRSGWKATYPRLFGKTGMQAAARRKSRRRRRHR